MRSGSARGRPEGIDDELAAAPSPNFVAGKARFV
jgi:hypothetical protein